MPKEASSGYLPSDKTTIELFGVRKLNQVYGAVAKAYLCLRDKKKKRISHMLLQLEKKVKQKDGYAVASGDRLIMMHKPNDSVIRGEPKKRLMTGQQ